MFNFLSEKISNLFTSLTGQNKLSERNIDEALLKLNDTMLEADIPYDVVQEFIKEVKSEVVGKKVFASLKPTELLMKIVYDKIVQFLGGESNIVSFDIPSVIMVMGLQGAGKTTTIAKLINYFNKEAEKRGKKRRCLVASVDFYRPAAIDQLEIVANQAGGMFYRSTQTKAIDAAKDIFKKYQEIAADYLILDTAGRLHVDQDMLSELQQINNIIKPKYKLIVVDSMVGQESLKVAQAFEAAVGFNGAILTKMDSDTRGGVAFAFRYVLKKPIYFLASGEKMDDLELFHPDRIANRIIGMGDVKSLVEKAQEKIKQNDQEKIYKSFESGKLTLVDFAQQIEMVNKMGSLTSLMKYMPGMGSLKVSPEMLQKGEAEMKRFKAIIGSMTLKERYNHQILNGSRKNRIAKGAGVSVSDINALIAKFEQTQQFAKIFKKMGNFKGF